jgi:hypothetical protein
MVAQGDLVLGLDWINPVFEHLLVRVKPEREWQTEERGPRHDLDILNRQLLTVLWWQSVEVGQS